MGAVQKKTRFSEIAFEVKYEDIGLEEAEGPPNDVVRGHLLTVVNERGNLASTF